MAEKLNAFVISIPDQPWLDLAHDGRTRIFDISHFEFEPDAGIFAVGKFTELGRALYDAGRVSGVSIAAPVAIWNRRPICAAFDFEISEEDAAKL
jgi:hypothetical protein